MKWYIVLMDWLISFFRSRRSFQNLHHRRQSAPSPYGNFRRSISVQCFSEKLRQGWLAMVDISTYASKLIQSRSNSGWISASFGRAVHTQVKLQPFAEPRLDLLNQNSFCWATVELAWFSAKSGWRSANWDGFQQKQAGAQLKGVATAPPLKIPKAKGPHQFPLFRTFSQSQFPNDLNWLDLDDNEALTTIN